MFNVVGEGNAAAADDASKPDAKTTKKAAASEENKEAEEVKENKAENADGDEDEKRDEDGSSDGAANGIPKVAIDWNKQGWNRNYLDLTEQEKLSMMVDEIFALYLYTVSQKVNDSFYRTVLAFVIFFRECLNEIGWKKRRESDTETKPEDLDALE